MRASDIKPLVELWTNADVTRHVGGPRDRDWLQSTFEEIARDPFAERFDLWPLVEKETGRVVGDCGLLEKDVEGEVDIELNYFLTPSSWGKGYAEEIGRALVDYAFEVLGLRRLIALIDPENSASQRVAEKVGMRADREIIRPGGVTRKVYVVESGKEGAD